jgi:hypothetical protein
VCVCFFLSLSALPFHSNSREKETKILVR